MKKTNSFEVVIGSWGSYNACNERALGSHWLDFADFESWEEIEEELRKEGFELDGIDSELFIQDIDFDLNVDCDTQNPAELFKILKASGILENEYAFEAAKAYCEIEGFEYFAELVEKDGANFDDNFVFYAGMDLGDVAEELFVGLGEISEDSPLYNYIDWEAVARDLSYDGYHETSNGVICIY